MLPRGAVRRAVRLSFVQAMLGAVYAASTGGMFLIGYALRLGATNVHIGLLSTIPMLCIGVQLGTAALIERGMSRRRLTLVASLLNVACWLPVMLLPYVVPGASVTLKVGVLITALTVLTFFAFVAGNARGSWVGDLIPVRFRGTFFGRATMYSGIIASLFAIGEGAFLDVIKQHGLAGFTILFGFGMVFGVVGALLFLPQADIPAPRHENGANLPRLLLETLLNRSLRIVMLFAVIWSLQAVAGPFYVTYMLRDLGMSFVGIGIINATFMLSCLLSAPLWGRAVDRWGCRPVLTACAVGLGAMQFSWLWLDTAHAVYCTLPLVNIASGASAAGVSVALSTLLYKVTPSRGRSVHFAVYSIVVVLVTAPLPSFGGHLPDWFAGIGLPADLRLTFYTGGLFMMLSALVARRIHEPGARSARHMLRELGTQWLLPILRWRY